MATFDRVLVRRTVFARAFARLLGRPAAPTGPPPVRAGQRAVDAPAAPEPAGADPAARDDATAGLCAALREPLLRASTAASMLRLLAPALPAAAERELLRIEEELALSERRLSALRGASARGDRPPAPVDLPAVVGGIARTLAVPPGVRIHAPEGEGVALADEARLRPALREALRGAAATVPQGGEVRLRVERRENDVVLEIAVDGVAADREPWIPFVRALLGPAARVQGEAVPGRGMVCRIALPAAAPEFLDAEEIQEIHLLSEP